MKVRLYPKGGSEWRNALLRLLVATALILAVPVVAAWWFAHMPGDSHQGALPPLSSLEKVTRVAAQAHVEKLAGEIGTRSVYRPAQLAAAADYIARCFQALGLQVEEQTYEVEGVIVRNLEVTLPGTEVPQEILVVGAHYDTYFGTPGADDNASGVAGLLELARLLRQVELKRTVRLVAFVNEEPPHFHNEDMGSLRYALRCKEKGEEIVGMLALEMLGYYVDEPGVQKYPPGLDRMYPEAGNFIGFVGNLQSGGLVKRTIKAFRESTAFPSEGLVGPAFINGVSDNWSFWQAGYPALMVTDTAFFRNANYHQPTDTPATLDYARLARVVVGLARTIETLANE